MTSRVTFAGVCAPVAAVLTTGCVGEPWTPSVSVGMWAQPPPDGHIFAGNVDTASLLNRWSLPSSDPWSRYQKMTLLSAAEDMEPGTKLPDTGALDVVRTARLAGRRLGEIGIPADTMVMVDLRGAASVAFGAELSRAAKTPVSLVLTFNNWPHEDEMVPAEETLTALINESPRPGGGGTPVLLLDAWRLAYQDEEPEPGVVDNRYIVSNLPPAAELARAGIRHVIYLVESLDDTDVEEDDLNETFLAWQTAGVHISMLDLAGLDERPAPYPWDSVLFDNAIIIGHRPLVIHNPRFYIHAHGGFGGLRAAPGVAGGHAHWGGHGFSGGGHGGHGGG